MRLAACETLAISESGGLLARRSQKNRISLQGR